MNLLHHFQPVPYGPNAWLLQAKEETCEEISKTILHNLYQQLDRSPHSDLKEFTLGYESILLEFHPSFNKQQLLDWIGPLSETTEKPFDQEPVRIISVQYDGPDLEAVAHACKLSTAEVISIHSSCEYTVRFIGFSPGFVYLDGLDPRLCIPRKKNPRKHIKPGAVAIGGKHAGVYSIESPGGWHWLGNTKISMFEVEQLNNFKDAFHLAIGDRVRFQPQS